MSLSLQEGGLYLSVHLYSFKKRTSIIMFHFSVEIGHSATGWTAAYHVSTRHSQPTCFLVPIHALLHYRFITCIFLTQDNEVAEVLLGALQYPMLLDLLKAFCRVARFVIGSAGFKNLGCCKTFRPFSLFLPLLLPFIVLLPLPGKNPSFPLTFSVSIVWRDMAANLGPGCQDLVPRLW